ncbi:MAG: redoxin domain-containing protein [Prolixibacteraceae bacterium]|jgi:thioredoxin-related protein|nr:redoxin domain-containing protein [Prolixibacteraceae bacterium]NLO03965.1 redoxin domain-containing protein [Bacteroidales bacterium]
MKKLVLFLMVSVFVPLMVFSIGIGSKATLTDVKMLDISGKRVSLTDAALENGLLVIFSSNTCPFVMQWEGRYTELKSWADKHKVGMIVLNSNYQNRNDVDSYARMQEHAKAKNYNFYYVVDEESKIANAFGGQTTPHVFLFDQDMTLVYKGAVDDNYKNAGEVKQAYVKDAIASMVKGEKIEIAETRPLGCSIKRKAD